MVELEDLRGRFTSRKFIGAVWLHIASSLLLWAGQLTSTDWVEFNTWLFGIYAGSNAASKFGNAMKRRGKDVGTRG